MTCKHRRSIAWVKSAMLHHRIDTGIDVMVAVLVTQSVLGARALQYVKGTCRDTDSANAHGSVLQSSGAMCTQTNAA